MAEAMEQSTSTPADTEPSVSVLLDHIRQSFSSAPRDFTFACGGSIPITVEATPDNRSSPSGAGEIPPSAATGSAHETGPEPSSSSERVQTRPSPPITLRWDPENTSTPASQCKLTLPLKDGQEDILAGLVRDMKPATFGFQGEDVYDESYRKALKLDTSRFASTFNPYELGIVDAVAQLLLPNLLGRSATRKRGVRAELYKLNAYSGPSDHFHPHVDTPLSLNQFASLVVCLPVAHTGGQLKVQHLGKDVVFDWGANEDGTEKPPAIQWAAFYSDCTHEVLKVTSGHRLTLTYTLYATYGNGSITGLSSVIDMAQLSLYKKLSSLLDREDFLDEGGHIGIYTTFAYPHTSNYSCLPEALKGSDMAVWEILGSLGCRMKLLPVATMKDETLVGKTLKWKNVDSLVDEYSGMSNLINWWSRKYKGRALKAEDVFWLNEPNGKTHKQPQMSYLAYGNEASLGVIYTECAIIAVVSPYEDRKKDSPA
ncbi:hypothetical protein F5Y03DRAFT_378833 [Xylaria venustula]|nr:hypothetical protein F5Y03DRAFT_378833 [Xylaria venustula]